MKISGIANIFQRTRNKKDNNVSFGTIIPGFPTTIELGISKNCNLRCSYCPNSFLKETTPDLVMPMGLFEKVLNDLKAIDYDGIFHFHRFNEPLLVTVEKYIAKAKDILPKIRTELFTNGTLLTKERLESLKDTPLDEIIVTQHTPRGFIDKLDKIPDELLKNVDVKYGEELRLINRAGVLRNPDCSLQEHCYCINTSLAIDSNGEVPLCIDDYHRQIVLGDVHNETIEQIWNSPLFGQIREILARGNRKDIAVCRNCDRTEGNRILSTNLSKNSALYRKHLLITTGSAHLPKPEKS